MIRTEKEPEKKKYERKIQGIKIYLADFPVTIHIRTSYLFKVQIARDIRVHENLDEI